MQGLCKDCDFWTKVLPYEWKFTLLQNVTHTGECSCKKFIPVGENAVISEVDEFVMFDDMGYRVDFYPCAHFGCIHFKARP